MQVVKNRNNVMNKSNKENQVLSDDVLFSLSSEEYFEYFGLDSYLKDSLSLCLEVQPKNELNFFYGLVFFSFFTIFLNY